MSASSLPQCSNCGNTRGPWRPSGEVLPSGEQVMVCQAGCPVVSPELANAVAEHGPFPMPTGTTDPVIVSRFDVAMEPAIEEEQVLIVGAVADDGRPVALLLDMESRSKVARWLAPELEAAGLASPWERAVAGLNALVDAGVAFHVDPDGHISAPFSDEHIEWDLKARRWVLTHDDEDDEVPPPRDLRPGADAARRMIRDRQTAEDPHDSPLHHRYDTPRDLPEMPW